MNKSYIYTRNFYCIDNFRGKEKWFEYLGFSATIGKRCFKFIIEDKLINVLNHEDGIRGWIEEHLEKLIDSDIEINEFKDVKQFKECIDHFFYNELSGEEKSLDTININTPCGNYWSRME